MAQTFDISISHIFISQGHNFVGRHGMEPDAFQTTDVESVECVAGKGLMGDRFFDHKPDWKGQITFFDEAVYHEVLKAFFDSQRNIEPSVFRRNVIVKGIDLNQLIGQTFSIGDVEYSGVEECSPCYWMNTACAEGAHEFLKGRGGLRARIKTDGLLKKGPTTLHLNG